MKPHFKYVLVIEKSQKSLTQSPAKSLSGGQRYGHMGAWALSNFVHKGLRGAGGCPPDKVLT